MNKKILSIITALLFILQGLSAFAAAPAITILSPSKGEIVASDSLVLAASASDADEVRFYLDGVEVARFEGSGDFEYVCEKASYGNHIFRAVALARGATLRETQNSFSIRDFSESEVKNLNCNDFDGASISTSGFSGFQQNIDTTGTPNGKLGLGKGPDGSGCIMLQGAKKNNTNLYLPFINFALSSTNPDKYTIEHDVFVSDDGMRLSYEFAGVFNIIMDSSVGSFVLEPQKWYKIKSIFDFNAGTYEVYVDGELQSSGSAGALSKTEVRVSWASRKSEDGYLLLDNFVVNRSIATPVVSEMEYLKDDVWNKFTAELPLGTKQVKFYLDGALTPASKDSFAFYQNGEETATNYEFTSDGAILVTFVDDLTPKASCIAEYSSGQFGGKFTASFTVGDRALYVRKLDYNAGSYKPQYACQLTDDASVTTRVIISNSTGEDQAVFVITAVYKNGAMVSCAASEGVARAGSNATVNVPAVAANSQCTISSYVVDSWADRKPLTLAGSLIE